MTLLTTATEAGRTITVTQDVPWGWIYQNTGLGESGVPIEQQ